MTFYVLSNIWCQIQLALVVRQKLLKYLVLSDSNFHNLAPPWHEHFDEEMMKYLIEKSFNQKFHNQLPPKFSWILCFILTKLSNLVFLSSVFVWLLEFKTHKYSNFTNRGIFANPPARRTNFQQQQLVIHRGLLG